MDLIRVVDYEIKIGETRALSSQLKTTSIYNRQEEKEHMQKVFKKHLLHVPSL